MSERDKATPGPWRVSDRSIVTDDVCIADVDDHGEYADWEHWDANAVLIAAAPDLLKACEAQERVDDHIANCDECCDEVSPELCEEGFPLADDARTLRRAAVAKARGKESER